MEGYTLLRPRRQQNDVDPDTGLVVPGWTIPWRDDTTGTRGETFVPLSVYSAANVQTLVERAVSLEREIDALSRPLPAA